MATETYTLRIEEADSAEGISVDLYNDGGAIDESTWIDYDDHGLAVSREGEPPASEQEVTTDAMRLDLQIERLADAFEVRLLGDTGTLETQRIEDEEWGLERADA
jgi:hypothetical protein